MTTTLEADRELIEKRTAAEIKFSKLYIALKFRLQGEKMFDAARALEIGKRIHSGFRKDNYTPSFQHQVQIALAVFLLKGIEDLEGAVICALLHDTDEDFPHDVPMGTFESFGETRHKTIRMLNKNTHNSTADCWIALGSDKLGSIVKGEDRDQNFQTMHRGGFAREKKIRYRTEVVDMALPMLKEALKNFPDQMDAYYSIINRLKDKVEYLDLYLAATENG